MSEFPKPDRLESIMHDLLIEIRIHKCNYYALLQEVDALRKWVAWKKDEGAHYSDEPAFPEMAKYIKPNERPSCILSEKDGEDK